MPKGFLVKRSKKTGPVSYRMREEEEDLALVAADISPPHPVYASPSVCYDNFFIRFPVRGLFGGVPESLCAPSLSPARPDSEGYPCPATGEPQQISSSSASPAPAETFPEPDLGSFGIHGSPEMAFHPEMTTKFDSSSKSASVKRPGSSKPKSNQNSSKKKRKTSSQSNPEKKASVRDEVTTSPVLGLRITEEVEDEVKQRSNTGSPFGEFVCQLCKERYADPLTLAHHRCSRIVRVEYRCDECDKVFSCPANLASHRRWHKPRGAPIEVPSPKEESGPSTPTTGRDTRPPSPQTSDSSFEEDMFSCPQCSKKFRRQAYLRKHLALHTRKAASNPPSHTGLTEHPSTGPDPTAPPVETPETSTLHPEKGTGVAGEVFPCRFCDHTFFSSPGLTRHINRYHPTESRQVIVLSQI